MDQTKFEELWGKLEQIQAIQMSTTDKLKEIDERIRKS